MSLLQSWGPEKQSIFGGVRKRVKSRSAVLALCWRSLLCQASIEGGTCLQMVRVLCIWKSWGTKGVFLLRNCSKCVYRHHLQERKLWVRNDHRTLVEGGNAFCAVSLNSDHLIILYSAFVRHKMKEGIGTNYMRLLSLLASCELYFWRGLWLVNGKGIHWLISCAEVPNPSLSYKHLHSWWENKSPWISSNLNTEGVLWWGVFVGVFCITSKFSNRLKCLKALETPNMLFFLLPCTLEELSVFP